MADIEERPRFYEGQFLGASDLTAAVDYSRSQFQRAQVGAHTWGIALGLDLVEVPGPNGTLDVFIEPGYAWDGFGRPIVVASPTKIPSSLFATFDADFVTGNPPPPPRPIDVWLNYDERMTQGPPPGFETCDAEDAFARVVETFTIVVGPKNTIASQRDPIVIAGQSMDSSLALKTFDATAPEIADASVPQQDLPESGDRKLWLIPLGTVLWQPGNPGLFTARTQAELDRTLRTRRYSGAVAEAIETRAGRVRIHDRGAAYSTFFTEELLWVEGETRLDGHARLYGKRIEFVRSHTENPRAPFHVLRTDDPALNKIALRLVIGDQAAGDNRLSVGPKNGVDAAGNDTYAEGLVVTDKGFVGIGTSDPKGPLHIAADGIEIGTSATPDDNFYLQSNTDGPRALRIYKGDFGAGTHIATFGQNGRVGVGTTDPANMLHVNGATGIRQNALYLSGNPDWSSVTFNAFHNEGNNAWSFPDPTKPAVTMEMDAFGGVPRCEIFSTTLGNNQAWISRLKVSGHTGDVAMAYNGGNVGVGTFTPGSKLDVQGGSLNVSGDVRFGNGAFLAAGAASAVRIVWGTVSTGTNIIAGEGFTVIRMSEGRYEVTFSPGFPTRPAASVTGIYLNPDLDAGTAADPKQNAIIDLIQSNRMIVVLGDANGALSDGAFTFIVIGPR
jgi:hypothetical protein